MTTRRDPARDCSPVSRAARLAAAAAALLFPFHQAAAQTDPQTESARDLYVEGWFQETAEADLEAALRAYRRSVEVATPAEQDVAARALWRMGRIALARGDAGAARALFERVRDEYPGTAAAARAAADLERSNETAEPAGQAVERAREYLVEMLEGRGKETARKKQLVLENLGVAEIVETCRLHGRTVDVLLMPQTPLLDKRVDLTLADGSELALRTLFDSTDAAALRSAERFDELLEAAGSAPYFIAHRAFGVLAGAAGGVSPDLPRLRLFIDRPAFAGGAIDGGDIRALAVIEDPLAAEVLHVLLRRALEHDQFVASDVPSEVLDLATPAADRLRAAVAELSPGQRLDVFSRCQANRGAQRGPSLDAWRRDPDPLVRREAVFAMMRANDADLVREGFREYRDSGPPWDYRGLDQALDNTQGRLAAFEFLAGPPGALLEFLCWVVLLERPDEAGRIVAEALERDRTDALHALFDSRILGDPRFVAGDELFDPGRAGVLNPWPNQHPSDGFVLRVSRALCASPVADLHSRLAEAVRATGDPRLRRACAEYLLWLGEQPWSTRDVRAAAALFSEDPWPAIRMAVVRSGFPSLDRERQTRLLLDPIAKIASAAAAQCEDPGPLAEAAKRCAAERLPELFARARWVGDLSTARAVYERTDPDSELCLQAFDMLSRSSVDLVLDALARGDHSSAVNRRAAALLGELDLPADLAAVLVGLDPNASMERYEEAARRLRERETEVAAAWRARRIEDTLRAVRTGAIPPESAATTLVSMSDADELARRIAGPVGDDNEMLALLDALTRSGRREDVRAALYRMIQVSRAMLRAVARGGDPALVIELHESGVVDEPDVLFALFDPDAPAPTPEFVDFLIPRSEERMFRRRLHLIGDGQAMLGRAIDRLAAAGDAVRLNLAAIAYDEPRAVFGLFQIGAVDTVLRELPSWPRGARSAAIEELRRQTGIPHGRAAWPRFAEEQEALLASWRAALKR